MIATKLLFFQFHPHRKQILLHFQISKDNIKVVVNKESSFLWLPIKDKHFKPLIHNNIKIKILSNSKAWEYMNQLNMLKVTYIMQTVFIEALCPKNKNQLDFN